MSRFLELGLGALSPLLILDESLGDPLQQLVADIRFSFLCLVEDGFEWRKDGKIGVARVTTRASASANRSRHEADA